MMQDQSQLPPPPQMVVAERLNQAVQQQLNLEHVKTRAISLFKAISRILEEFDAYARSNANPKWQDVLGQFSMVNLELFNIVDEIKKVSKAFIVQPKNVNAENATILPVMLSSKLLPEMEVEDNFKKEQLLQGLQSFPISSQIEKLKNRIDMIGAACESAEKVLADTRKVYQFGTRQGPAILPTLDKSQAAKIQEQENSLRAAVNVGEGLRVTGDQRQITSGLPVHLADVLSVGDGVHGFSDSSGMYMKSTPPLSSNTMNNQGPMLQASGSALVGRSAASPSAGTSVASFENTTASPLPYANSPRSGANIINTPSPQQQQQTQQQHHHQQQQLHQQQQQQQRQKMMQQLPQSQQQQLLAAQQQQQFRQSQLQGLGQNQLQLHDLSTQGQQQKYQTMQFSQALGGHQQFQARQLSSSGHVQHGMGQSSLNQGNQLNRLNQYSNSANNALFNAAQGASNTQMIPNMSATMTSQPMVPRVQQFGLGSNNPQRSHQSQIMNDQMFNNMGVSNPVNMMTMQSQQQQLAAASQGAYGNMQQPNAQNLQATMAAALLPNFVQQRQQNQQQ